MRNVQYTENLKLSQIEDESLPWWYGTLNEDNRKIEEGVSELSDAVFDEETGLASKVNALDDEINNEETGLALQTLEAYNLADSCYNAIYESDPGMQDGLIYKMNEVKEYFYVDLSNSFALDSQNASVVSGGLDFGETGQTGAISNMPRVSFNSGYTAGYVFGSLVITNFVQTGGRVTIDLGIQVTNNSGVDYTLGAIFGMAQWDNKWIPLSTPYMIVKANGELHISFLISSQAGTADNIRLYFSPGFIMFSPITFPEPE